MEGTFRRGHPRLVGNIRGVHNWWPWVEPPWAQDLEYPTEDKKTVEATESSAPILFLPSKDGVFRPVFVRKLGFRKW